MKDFELTLVEDRPEKGMWHCGPNACWITATHIPTRTSICLYSGEMSQHKARETTLQLLELALDASRAEKCKFPERKP